MSKTSQPSPAALVSPLGVSALTVDPQFTAPAVAVVRSDRVRTAWDWQAAGAVGLLARLHRRYGVVLPELDLGGGHAVAYQPGEHVFDIDLSSRDVGL